MSTEALDFDEDLSVPEKTAVLTKAGLCVLGARAAFDEKGGCWVL